MAGRAGLATRGVLYLVSALLTMRVALADGSTSEEGPGKPGALAEVAQQPFGRVLVALLALGLLAYAVWRIRQASDVDDDGGGGWFRRISYLVRAAVYLVAMGVAISLLTSDEPDRSSGSDQEPARTVFDLPGGRWIVLLVGAGLLGTAGYNAWKALSRDFEDEWSPELNGRQRRIAGIVGVVGLWGHTLVFALIGWFVAKAAWEFDPDEPQSLDAAVRTLADESHGLLYLGVLATGMAAYGVFSLVDARWRDMAE